MKELLKAPISLKTPKVNFNNTVKFTKNKAQKINFFDNDDLEDDVAEVVHSPKFERKERKRG